ncbi:MAG: SemiSWEET transporter [Methanoregulaceae archaeon]|jgi:MtN3 and saliva related transmembrane protein|nr:SemiSWEET transporter [Methanoregulaceae archaeon]
MDFVPVLGYVAGFCTTVAFLPQVYRAWKTKSCKDLSPGMLILFAVGIFLWLIFGILIQELPIIIANGVTFFLVLLIVVLKFRFD